jgi:hypothetical protein
MIGSLLEINSPTTISGGPVTGGAKDALALNAAMFGIFALGDITDSGETLTAIIEESNDQSSWTTAVSFTPTATSVAQRKNFARTKRYLRGVYTSSGSATIYTISLVTGDYE